MREIKFKNKMNKLKTIEIEDFEYFKQRKEYAQVFKEIGTISEKSPDPKITIFQKVPFATISDNEHETIEPPCYLTIKCPYCKYERFIPLYKEEFIPKEKVKKIKIGGLNSCDFINYVNIERLFRGFCFHMEARVRLSGCLNHMKYMNELFGEDYTQKKLKEWRKKSFFVAKQIKYFLDKK